MNLMQKEYCLSTVGFFLLAVIFGFFLVGCQKKPIIEVEEVHSALAGVQNRCASAYAAEDLERIQPLIESMDMLAANNKRKNTIEKANEALAVLEQISEITESRKEGMRIIAEAAKERAEEELVRADKELSLFYAKDLVSQAEEFLKRGREILRGSDCRLEESHAFFVISAEHSIKAREFSIAERERIAVEEAEKRRLEVLKEIKPPEKKEVREWVVAKGDSLWRISAREEIFDNPLLWPLIFWANRSQIMEPDILYEGQKLKIPRNVKAEEVEQALREAKTGEVSGMRTPMNGR